MLSILGEINYSEESNIWGHVIMKSIFLEPQEICSLELTNNPDPV